MHTGIMNEVLYILEPDTSTLNDNERNRGATPHSLTVLHSSPSPLPPSLFSSLPPFYHRPFVVLPPSRPSSTVSTPLFTLNGLFIIIINWFVGCLYTANTPPLTRSGSERGRSVVRVGRGVEPGGGRRGGGGAWSRVCGR